MIESVCMITLVGVLYANDEFGQISFNANKIEKFYEAYYTFNNGKKLKMTYIPNLSYFNIKPKDLSEIINKKCMIQGKK